jgi:hypothetical protein
MVWMALFGYPHVKSTIQKFKQRQWNGKGESVNDQYSDQLNILMRSYKEVPLWWFMALFMASFVIIITAIAKGHLCIPIWTYFIAMATGAVVVIVRIPDSPRGDILLTYLSSHWDGSMPCLISNS